MKRTTGSEQNMISKAWFITAFIAATMAVVIVSALPCFAGRPPESPDKVANRQSQTVSINNFEESIHHALMKYKDGKPPYRRYRPDDHIHIAGNLLRWQNHDGGWPKNIDWLKVLTREDQEAMPSFKKSKPAGSTLDNYNIWTQIDYLARVRSKTHLKRYDAAINRAIDFLLEQQHPSGGWSGSDVDAITFNDHVMVGVIRTLRQISEDDRLYGFVNATRRLAAEKAYAKGIACILRCQIRMNGKLTAWAQQYNHETFLPVQGRHYEFPFPATRESVEIIRLLMEIQPPDGKVVGAIEAAVSWLNIVKIKGLKIRKVQKTPVQYRYHWTDFDRVEVREQGAPPIWARFYDLKTQKPVFTNRDKQMVRRYQDLTRERRTGYEWYGDWPARLLKQDYPAWRKKIKRTTDE